VKLINIRLHNFRQFYGQQSIAFSTDPQRNLTLFHAENGVGKTTLLNSILWCFYGRPGVTEKFGQSADDILSYQAAGEGETQARVEVTFEHEARLYTVCRRHRKVSETKIEESLDAYEIDDGNTAILPAAEDFVSSVVPREMAHHYFFDGEHAETFASPNNFRQVGEAIKNMLGSNIADCAIEDLKWAAKQFGEQLGALPGEDRIRQKTQELEQVQGKLDRLIEIKAEQEESLTVIREQIAQIDEQLADSRIAKDLHRQRRELEAAKASAAQVLSEVSKDTLRWIGRKSLPMVANRLSEQTLHFIDEEKLRGKIPSPYNEDLVHHLLAQEECICGRPLEPGTEHFGMVQNLLRRAGNAVVQNRVMRARGRITQLREARLDAPKDLQRMQREKAAAFEQQRITEQKLHSVSERLLKIDEQHIAANEKARLELLAKQSRASEDIGRAKVGISSFSRDVEQLKAEQQRLSTSNAKAMRLLNRRTLADRASGALRAILDGHEADAKAFISREVNTILKTTARRDYRFSFGEGFNFDLTYENGRTVPRSSGENQLLSLAFIAALIKFCKDRSVADGSSFLIPGIVAPLVLDSPFGQLDNTYRSDTARFIPEMAQQVALFVSSSQGSADVLDVLKDRIGKQYVLISENSGPRDGRHEERIVLGGKVYETSLFNLPKNMTRIEAVGNHA
jgi:DNA sulfur modification protein DndD